MTTIDTMLIEQKKSWGTAARLFMLCLATVILVAIVIVKSKGGTTLGDPLLIFYTIFITTFELSRIIGAMYYEKLDQKIQSSVHVAGGGDVPYEPTVSIVVPCKNEEKSIEKTVRKSFEAKYPPEKLEVIVINDGSTDNTGIILDELKKEYGDRLTIIHWAKNRGKRHGMAVGFKKATGEIVVQLDSDSYLDPETFRNVLQPFYNSDIGAVCAHADPENADENLLTRTQAAYYFMSFRILKAAESAFTTVFCCSGCSSAYRKDVVLPIMDIWLEETFLGLPVTWGDDRALTNWVLRRGYKTIYTDKAQAYTIVPTTLRQFMRQQARWKKGWFVNSIFASKFIYKKHPFVSFTYFFPLIFITLVTPFMAVKAFFYNPIVKGISPLYYVVGIFLIASLITVYYRYVAKNNKYWPYIFVWSSINLVFLSFVLFYALLTIQNRKWGTR